MEPKLREPTHDECTRRAKVYEDEAFTGHAIWYPQMGGYVSHAVVLIRKGEDNTCFEAYVWHDGEFPFSGDDGSGRSPARIHHCDPEQFVHFGKAVRELMGRLQEATP